MGSSDSLEIIWEVIEVLPAGKYRVKLCDMDFTLIWYKAGRMKKNNITIMEGDIVKIEINEYDNTQWRIVYRFKDYPKQAKTKIDVSVIEPEEEVKEEYVK